MPNQIPRPTQGRVVHFFDQEGNRYAGIVDKDYKTSPEGVIDARCGSIDINYFDGGKLRFAENVSYSGDGTRFSWRYPAHTDEKIKV